MDQKEPRLYKEGKVIHTSRTCCSAVRPSAAARPPTYANYCMINFVVFCFPCPTLPTHQYRLALFLIDRCPATWHRDWTLSISNNMNPTQSRHDQSSWSNLTSLGTTKQVSCSAITTMVLTAGFLTLSSRRKSHRDTKPLRLQSWSQKAATKLPHFFHKVRMNTELVVAPEEAKKKGADKQEETQTQSKRENIPRHCEWFQQPTTMLQRARTFEQLSCLS